MPTSLKETGLEFIHRAVCSVCVCVGLFVYLQDDVVVQDVEGVIQRVDGQVCRPLQTHLWSDANTDYIYGNCISIKKKKNGTKEQESLGGYHPQESVAGDTNNISLIT